MNAVIEIPNGMNMRQHRFALEYIANGNNATQACISAGYSEKGAAATGSKLLRNPKIKSFIAAQQAKTVQKLEVSAEYLARSAVEVLERSLQKVSPIQRAGENVVGEGPDGSPAYVYQYDGTNALKAIELLGRWNAVKMWDQSVELTGPGGGPVQQINVNMSAEEAAQIYKDMMGR